MNHKNKKKIVFIIGYMSNGGAERVVSVLANNFVNRGYKVSILAILGDKKDYELDDNIEYKPLMSKHKNKLMRVVERILFIRKNTKKEECDVIVSLLAQINIYSIVANIFNNVKLIVSERNDPYQDPNNKIIRFIRDILYQFTDGLVFQTPDAMNYFSKKIQNKSTIIANPLKEDLPECFEGERNKEIVTAVRLEPQKNIKMLIDSYIKIQREYPEYILKIYGNGYLKDELIEYCNENNVKDKVKFLGYSKNLHSEIIKSQMFVLSSNYEGISNSMIEALALGIPVISTDHPIGGARMFIESGVNGLLVPVGDVEEMYNCMKMIIKDRTLTSRISNNAVKIREILDVNNITNKWENFILEDIRHDS